jgi:hypothetical protein
LIQKEKGRWFATSPLRVSKAVYFPMHRFPKEPVRLVY